MDRQLRVTDEFREQHMRDLELNFLLYLSSHYGFIWKCPTQKCSQLGCRESSTKLTPQSIQPLHQTESSLFAYWDFSTARMIITMHTASGINDLITAMRNCDSVIFYGKRKNVRAIPSI